MTLPTALTPAAAAAGVWIAASGRPVPGIVGALSALAAYAVWIARGRRWHDLAVVGALLPALAAGVWVRGGAGLALSGLAAALAGYQGRHPPSAP